MKTIFWSACLLILTVGSVHAQKAAGKNAFWISKDVQRLQVREDNNRPARVVGTTDASISKGVQSIGRRFAESTGTVIMTGIPAVAISKGVALMQHQHAYIRRK